MLAALSVLKADTRPNIVFLMTDDQRWDTLGCYGRPEFQTVNIDKLASEGVVFDNSYHAVAICMPSRVSLMTGRHFASHNSGFTYPHNDDISKKHLADTYHAKLKAAGYRSGFVGKFGFRVEGREASLKPHFDYMDANNTHAKFTIAQPMWAKDMEGFKKIHRKGRSSKERTLIKGDSMLNFLDTQPEGKPFVLSVSFDAVKNDKDADMYGPDTEVFEKKDFSVPSNWVEGANEALPDVIKKNARGYSLHLKRSSTPEQYQRNTRRFATQGLSVDNQVGRLVEKLKEMKVLDNTIIIYTSDNGRYHGSHGLYDKAILHEESVKAPLVIWDGRVAGKEKGHRVNALASSVDIAPTILSLANEKAPNVMQGLDLTGHLNKTEDLADWREAVLMENLFVQEVLTAQRSAKKSPVDNKGINDDIISNNRSYRSRRIRSGKWKYFIYYEHTPVIEELYDLESDPDEVKNLAGIESHKDTLIKLREKTAALHKEYSDKGS